MIYDDILDLVYIYIQKIKQIKKGNAELANVWKTYEKACVLIPRIPFSPTENEAYNIITNLDEHKEI